MRHEDFGLVTRDTMAGPLTWMSRQSETLMVNAQADALRKVQARGKPPCTVPRREHVQRFASGQERTGLIVLSPVENIGYS